MATHAEELATRLEQANQQVIELVLIGHVDEHLRSRRQGLG